MHQSSNSYGIPRSQNEEAWNDFHVRDKTVYEPWPLAQDAEATPLNASYSHEPDRNAPGRVSPLGSWHTLHEDVPFNGVWRNQEIPSPVQSVSDHISCLSIDPRAETPLPTGVGSQGTLCATPHLIQPLPLRPTLQNEILARADDTMHCDESEEELPPLPQRPNNRDPQTTSRHGDRPPLPRRRVTEPSRLRSQTQRSSDLDSPPAMPARKHDRVTAPSTPTGQHEDSSSKFMDDKRSNSVQRFVGNMLPVRMGRAGLQTLSSTAQFPYYFSPWGDNSPMTLPNLRVRELALGGVSHVTSGALSPSSLSTVGKAIRFSMKEVADHLAEQGVDKLFAKSQTHVLRRKKAGIDSLDLRIKHKLIGERAEILLIGETATGDKRCCARAWFFPYLYASSRTPQLARDKDFSIAEFRGPGLAADAMLAPAVLSTFPETGTPLISFCPSEQSPNIPPFRRMAVFFAGISPHRGTWSQSRTPSEARISLHTFTHVPTIVVPIRTNAPIIAWSSWTLEQMTFAQQVVAAHSPRESQGKPHIDMDLAYGEMPHEDSLKQRDYDMHSHAKELSSYLGGLIDIDNILPQYRDYWGRWLDATLVELLDMAARTPEYLGWNLGGHCAMKRTGVVMFRY